MQKGNASFGVNDAAIIRLQSKPHFSEHFKCLLKKVLRWVPITFSLPHYAEAGCYYKKSMPNKTLQIQKI